MDVKNLITVLKKRKLISFDLIVKLLGYYFILKKIHSYFVNYKFYTLNHKQLLGLQLWLLTLTILKITMRTQ